MIAPFSWLKDYVDIDISAEQLQEKLFSCGFEVEELTYLGKDVTNVVVGKILSTEKHPDADRLTVCKVDCGEHGVKQICTAATNVFAGAKVPCALDGATVLHEGGVQKIKNGKLRGVLSEGMMCSGEELGITDDYYEGAEVNGILILDESEPVGADIRPIVGIDDYLFDIAVTANRPDCQCILGIAREVAAVLKKPFKMPALTYTAAETDVKIPVEVQEPSLCPRYVGHFVKDVKIGTSPRWMRRRLALCGLRSVSDIVDITNFVLLEMGQPMHAFDRNFLRGGKIVVRRAEEGENIVTLDEKQFSLHPDNLLICDGEGGVALAGIMGGLNSEIKPETKEVFFEAAKFARDSVRKTSRALGQRSDSSSRFEKGVDAYTCPVAMDRALCTSSKSSAAARPPATAPTSTRRTSPPRRSRVTMEKIDSLLGIEGAQGRGGRHLEAPLLRGERGRGSAPRHRAAYGARTWTAGPTLPKRSSACTGTSTSSPPFLTRASVTHGGWTSAQQQELKFKRVLAGEGFFEACNYSFYSPKDFDLFRLPEDAPERRAIRILNPIGEDLSVMRTFLAPAMLQNVVRNVRRGNAEGRLFELANAYLAEELPLKALPKENKRVTLAVWGDNDFFDLKGRRGGGRREFFAPPFLRARRKALPAPREDGSHPHGRARSGLDGRTAPFARRRARPRKARVSCRARLRRPCEEVRKGHRLS